MPAPLSDNELTSWAREHLVYEAGMLTFATWGLARRQRAPKGPQTNALLECFAIHVRCLDEFLWGDRGSRYPKDAFAADFCSAGVWEHERPDRSPALVEARKRDRRGREIVHLTYHRSDVPVAAKSWPVGEITSAILAALGDLAVHALPERLDNRTRAALQALGPRSTATEESYHGGTIPFRGFTETP